MVLGVLLIGILIAFLFMWVCLLKKRLERNKGHESSDTTHFIQ